MNILDNDKFTDLCNSIQDKISPQQFLFLINYQNQASFYSNQYFSLKNSCSEYIIDNIQLNNEIKTLKDSIIENQQSFDKRYNQLVSINEKTLAEYYDALASFSKILTMHNNSDTVYYYSKIFDIYSNQLSRQTQYIQEKTEEIQSLTTSIFDKSEEIRSLKNSISDKSEEISSFKISISEKDSQLESINRQNSAFELILRKKYDDILQLKSDLQFQTTKVDTYERILCKKYEEILQLKSELQQHTSLAYVNDLKLKKKKVDTYERILCKKYEEILQLKSELQQHTSLAYVNDLKLKQNDTMISNLLLGRDI